MNPPEMGSTPAGPCGYFLVGPTAVGKSAVAHHLARSSRQTILSADSMLIYKGMDIGVDKPGALEQSEVRYEGMDLAAPDQLFSVGDYIQRAAEAFRRAAGAPLLVVGGTGLYIKCLTEGLDALPPANSALRAQAESLLARSGLEALQQALQALDAGAYEALADKQNPRRLARAYELAAMGVKRPFVWPSAGAPVVIGLEMKLPDLYKRIDRRVQRMFQGGLLEEARRLREAYPQLSKTALQAIGYEEALACLDGGMSLAAACERAALRTRRLAKRQMTWFRHQANVRWVEVREGMRLEETAGLVRSLWSEYGPTTVRI